MCVCKLKASLYMYIGIDGWMQSFCDKKLTLTWRSSLCALLIPRAILAGANVPGTTTQAWQVGGEKPEK